MSARILLAALALAYGASAAKADDGAYRACVGKAGGNVAALARCGEERVARANVALDQALKSALADMPGGRRARRSPKSRARGPHFAMRPAGCSRRRIFRAMSARSALPSVAPA
ncbi:MAG: hypothetical protein U1E19_07040 [Rhodoblastus sp.]